MKIIVSAIGLIVVAGAGLVVAAGNAPQQAASSNPAQQAAVQPAAGGAAPAQKPLGSTPEEQAIVQGVDAFAKAFGAANTEALAAMFIDDCEVIDPDGNSTRGKAAVAEMYAASFQQSPGVKVEPKVEEIRFLTPDVVRAAGRSKLSSATGDAADFTQFSALLVRLNGTWRIAEIREHGAPAEEVKPSERLKELEWMLGDWVDDSPNNKVQASIRWADNQSYLVRTYTVEIQGEKATSGTVFIGWDPQSGQIKSWLFDSNGGHGEGLWTRTGDNEWVVKAQGVLYDGRPNSATQIHTIINKDSVKTSSIDRIIGGQVAPDILDLVMVRKPPQPAGGAPK
jgi:uncharacterized protein (TIGR02246 family)